MNNTKHFYIIILFQHISICFNYISTIFLFYLYFVSLVFSSSTHPDAGSTALTFLRFPVGARGSALAGYTAYAEGASGMCWNPAGIGFITSPEIEFSHTVHFQNITHNFLGYIFPTKNFVLGTGVINLYSGGIDRREKGLDFDESYVNLYQTTMAEGKFGVEDIAVIISCGKQIGKFSFGGNLKYVYEKIDQEKSQGICIDCGGMYTFNPDFRLSIVAKNLGTKIKFVNESYLPPIELGVGMLYRFHNMNLLFDIFQPIDNYALVSLGMEYSIYKTFFLRAGWKERFSGWRLGDYTGLSGGAGINFYGTRLDYSLTFYGVLGLSHKLSIGIEFDKIGKLYNLFRKRYAEKMELKPEIKVEKVKDKNEVVRPLQTQNNLFSQPVRDKTGLSHKYIFPAEIELINVDPVNKFFMYKINFTTSGINNLELKNLSAKVIVRNKKYNRNKMDIVVNVSTDTERYLHYFSSEEKIIKIYIIEPVIDSELRDCELHFVFPSNEKIKFYIFDQGQKIKLTSGITVNYQQKTAMYKVGLQKLTEIIITKE